MALFLVHYLQFADFELYYSKFKIDITVKKGNYFISNGIWFRRRSLALSGELTTYSETVDFWLMEYTNDYKSRCLLSISQIVDFKRYHNSTRWSVYHINKFVEAVSEQLKRQMRIPPLKDGKVPTDRHCTHTCTLHTVHIHVIYFFSNLSS